jgi:hypothetical protein
VDVDALNDRSLLADTPIGELRVFRYGPGVAVGVVDRHRPEKQPMVLHIVNPTEKRGTVLDAIYGKRFWEDAAVIAVHAQAAEQLSARDAKNEELFDGDFAREIEGWLKRDDARDVLFGGRR